MRQGSSAEEAATSAMKRIDQYYDDFNGAVLVVDKNGMYGKQSAYGEYVTEIPCTLYIV